MLERFKRKTYVVHSPQSYNLALAYEKGLKEPCYIAGRDSKHVSADKQYVANIKAIRWSKKKVIVIWDGSSDACFWWGAAFAMGKKCELVAVNMFETKGNKHYDA